MVTDLPDGGAPTDDDNLPLSITHSRDIIAFGGKIEQDYRFLNYRFRAADGDNVARATLDDIWEVSILEGGESPPWPLEVNTYL
jgi:hypothetical protein